MRSLVIIPTDFARCWSRAATPPTRWQTVRACGRPSHPSLLVVIDVALTESARLAHYVLPVASQFEKAEATFFNFEFPENYFHVRKGLMPPLPGLFSEAELHCRVLEALGELPAEPI